MDRQYSRPAMRPLAWFRPNPPAILTTLAAVLWLLPAAPALPDAPHPGAPGMLEPHTAGLLVDYYAAFLKDQDLDRFRQRVTARYTEATLGRLLESGTPPSRRAAVLALGLIGTMESNAALAEALADDDAIVRNLSENALWAVWFRADTPENNAALEKVRELIGRDRIEDARALATRLIERAPDFAEVYNQRAIAEYARGNYVESAADCRRVLERNPYHIGALSGLAQCYLHLDRRQDALVIFRRALELQPHSAGLRETIMALEAFGE